MVSRRAREKLSYGMVNVPVGQRSCESLVFEIAEYCIARTIIGGHVFSKFENCKSRMMVYTPNNGKGFCHDRFLLLDSPLG
jgi:hypothetical protein